MTYIESAEYYLPQSKRPQDAFQDVARRHSFLGSTIESLHQAEFEVVGEAVSDFFTAGVAYLANRGEDQYLQEVGATTWWAVNQHRVFPLLASDMIQGAIQLGVPPELARRQFKRNDEFHVIFGATKSGVQIIEQAYLLLPPEFMLQAMDAPIEALAKMAWLGSQVRDLTNGRLMIDQPNMEARAVASEAHFLHQVLGKHPELEVAPLYRDIMALYPNGIRSLPANVRYVGVSGAEFKTSNDN